MGNVIKGLWPVGLGCVMGFVRLSVRDWGPVREGAVEIRPLTVFIGPNNTGKSYLAMLFYALALSVSRVCRAVRLAVEELGEEVSSVVDAFLRGEMDEVVERVADVASGFLRRRLERALSSAVRGA